MSYERYMLSPEWRRKREQRLEFDQHTCQGCGATSKQYRLEVHHLTYERLENELIEDLQTLCVLCHPVATSEQRRKKYAKRVLVLSDFQRRTPMVSNEEVRDGVQNPKLQDYRRRTPPYA